MNAALLYLVLLNVAGTTGKTVAGHNTYMKPGAMIFNTYAVYKECKKKKKYFGH